MAIRKTKWFLYICSIFWLVTVSLLAIKFPTLSILYVNVSLRMHAWDFIDDGVCRQSFLFSLVDPLVRLSHYLFKKSLSCHLCALIQNYQSQHTVMILNVKKNVLISDTLKIIYKFSQLILPLICMECYLRFLRFCSTKKGAA